MSLFNARALLSATIVSAALALSGCGAPARHSGAESKAQDITNGTYTVGFAMTQSQGRSGFTLKVCNKTTNRCEFPLRTTDRSGRNHPLLLKAVPTSSQFCLSACTAVARWGVGRVVQGGIVLKDTVGKLLLAAGGLVLAPATLGVSLILLLPMIDQAEGGGALFNARFYEEYSSLLNGAKGDLFVGRHASEIVLSGSTTKVDFDMGDVRRMTESFARHYKVGYDHSITR